MSWDGTERRKIGFCDQHIELVSTLARIEERVINIDKRINGSIDDIKVHIEHGNRWRLAITSVALSLILAIISGVFAYGKLCGLVEDNTQEIARLRK
jgi:hypothetical protein